MAGGDAKTTEKQFPFYPGTTDLEFELQMVKNSAVMCAQENRFYNQFDSLSFDFILKNSIHHLTEVPLMDYKFDQDKIRVKMTKDQQLKLPSSVEVQILMTVHMTSNIFGPLIQSEKPVFQHILYSITYQPNVHSLEADLQVAPLNVIPSQEVVLDASATSVSNMPKSMYRK